MASGERPNAVRRLGNQLRSQAGRWTVFFQSSSKFRRVLRKCPVSVEPLHAGQCWGYAYRKIRGSAALSNHASGTAIDLNAPAHPLGEKGTFTAKQVTAIRRILTFCDGVVRWGGDFHGRKDEMHFEIVQSADDVALIAKKIEVARRHGH